MLGTAASGNSAGSIFAPSASLPHERSIPLSLAVERLQEDLASLGLRYRLTIWGRGQYTVVCKLLDLQLRQVSQGVGKGPFEQALAGALYESLEHYITMHKRDPENWSLESSHYFCGTEKFRDERVIDLLLMNPESKFLARTYIARETREKIKYPVFITDPEYADHSAHRDETFDSSLFRYTNNSGTAIGSSFLDAYLHASNEVIERDALSEFLAKNFYERGQSPIPAVTKALLPPGLSSAIAAAVEEIGQDIHVIDITNRFGVPSYMAVGDRFFKGKPLFGCGTSLDAAHAIGRSVSEVVQSFHVRSYAPQADEEMDELETYLRSYPRLHRCFFFDLPALIEKVGTRQVTAQPSQYMRYTVDEQCSELEARVRAGGSTIYSAIKSVLPNGTTTVISIIPGADRFFNVTMGLIVLPSKRLLSTSRASATA